MNLLSSESVSLTSVSISSPSASVVKCSSGRPNWLIGYLRHRNVTKTYHHRPWNLIRLDSVCWPCIPRKRSNTSNPVDRLWCSSSFCSACTFAWDSRTWHENMRETSELSVNNIDVALSTRLPIFDFVSCLMNSFLLKTLQNIVPRDPVLLSVFDENLSRSCLAHYQKKLIGFAVSEYWRRLGIFKVV